MTAGAAGVCDWLAIVIFFGLGFVRQQTQFRGLTSDTTASSGFGVFGEGGSDDFHHLQATPGATVYFQEILPKPSFSVFSAEYAAHSEDVFMLFGYSFLYPWLATDDDRNTTLRMIRTLADFAREGLRSAPSPVSFPKNEASEIPSKVEPSN
ncbi:hypothetical protein HPB47_005661 [Ixodes persulcatus]|uniref:Uncharacterized protein n=1 Tax=Ixodes persulcatus TaxID=34615 RepID=A0AC60PCR3_IXOPE|nr:hypothetical protein HPB47_005661 [Ixodes persulcatus]